MNYMNATPEAVLKTVFGYNSFRLLQKEIITNVLEKKDTLAIMPTGGGKSLCYQLPALMFEGITVVVSPLISLMQDQVESLSATGIPAVFLNSTVEWETYRETMKAIRRGEIKIVYVSPEGLMSSKIAELIHDPFVTISCITIDEAHCVSEWGHDFRPDYLEIASLRNQLKETFFLAFTATATAHVREDIIANLKLRNPKVFVSSFDRANIFLGVEHKQRNSLEQIIACIKRHDGESGIVYCFSKKHVDLLTEQLNARGFSALNYHAGLADSVRAEHQTRFIRDEVQIMVATLAFGMGINKPNVRFVIHNDIPKSLEQYYQEIGRAGRDGLPSEALLLYSAGDIHKIRYFFDEAADKNRSEALLNGMISYATGHICRRKQLLSYFGEQYTATNECCCDICALGSVPETDMTIPCQKLMSCIIRTNSRFGSAYIIDILLGARTKRILENGHNMISTWGIGRELDKTRWNELVSLLIEKKFILRFGEYNILMLTNDGLNALKNRDTIFLPFSDSKSAERYKTESSTERNSVIPGETRMHSSADGGILFPKSGKQKVGASFVLHKKNMDFSDDDEGRRIQVQLKKWRKNHAQELNVPPYIIFGDKTLNDIALQKPRTTDDLYTISGLGEKKVAQFGEAVLRIVKG